MVLQERHNIVLSDSIAKNVIVKNTKVAAFPGDTIKRLTDRICFGEVDLSQYDSVLIHIGTNDISDLICKNLLATTGPNDILRRFKVLRDVVRKQNPKAIIFFSSILPRATGLAVKKPSPAVLGHLAYGINHMISKWLSTSTSTFFVRSDKWFRSHGEVRDELFSDSDGLHLNGGGTHRLSQCFSQVLSPAGVKRFVKGSLAAEA